MAKLKAPLLSLGASGAIGKAIVYFNWKGLDVAREYVIPSNPKSASQVTQRGYLHSAVDQIHAAMSAAANPLISIDKSAYSLWASALGITMTWFNTAIKELVDKYRIVIYGAVFRGATLVHVSGQVTITLYSDEIILGHITAGNFKYGTSKTALLSTSAAVIDLATNKASKAIAGLTNGTQYFFQFVATADPTSLNTKSGIYHDTPHA